MVKFLPISYPHQCPHRHDSGDYCKYQERCFQIKCSSNLLEFPCDCPLQNEEPEITAEILLKEIRKTVKHIGDLLGMEYKSYPEGR